MKFKLHKWLFPKHIQKLRGKLAGFIVLSQRFYFILLLLLFFNLFIFIYLFWLCWVFVSVRGLFLCEGFL